MTLAALVSIGIAVEGLQFIVLGWILLEVYGFKSKLTGVCTRLLAIERKLHIAQ